MVTGFVADYASELEIYRKIAQNFGLQFHQWKLENPATTRLPRNYGVFSIVEPTGLEPMTSCTSSRRSSQLS